MRSKFEKKVAQELDNKGVDYEYESISLEYYERVRGGVCDKCGHLKTSKRRSYTPDFVINKGGSEGGHEETSGDCYDAALIIETKGLFTAANRTTMKLVKEWHPDLDIRMVFMRDNKVHKKSDMRYSDWCEKNGIPYAIGGIPEEWLKEYGY